MIPDLALLLAGMGTVVFSADKMVLSTAGLASRWGISPVIVGAIIIGFGSSLPELLVSLLALDQPNGLDLAVGNAVGSNIANISLVLAVGVIFYPFSGQKKVVRREGRLMVLSLLLVSAFLWDGALQIHEGVLLLLALLVVGVLVVRWSSSEDPTDWDEGGDQSPDRPSWLLGVVALAALVALLAGARAMVVGAENIAQSLGLSEGVVGLTILALGTSLPELGTVLASARRGRNDFVLGNVLGSNIFNGLGVIGTVGVVGPGSLVTDFRRDLVVMVAVVVLAGLAALSGDRLRRIEGVILLAAYPVAVVLAL
jgi:cation:H+ antiporter